MDWDLAPSGRHIWMRSLLRDYGVLRRWVLQRCRPGRGLIRLCPTPQGSRGRLLPLLRSFPAGHEAELRPKGNRVQPRLVTRPARGRNSSDESILPADLGTASCGQQIPLDDGMNAFVKGGVVGVVLVGVFAFTWFVYYPYSPLAKQEANLKLAEAHLPKVETSLRQVAGADRVRIGVHTGLGGALSISGEVADEQTAEAVIEAVLASSPPVTAQFLLTVGETNILRRIVAQGASANRR